VKKRDAYSYSRAKDSDISPYAKAEAVGVEHHFYLRSALQIDGRCFNKTSGDTEIRYPARNAQPGMGQ
jgi:hypothetical protein